MIKWFIYHWKRIWLFLTKWLKRTDFDNKVFSNFIDNKIKPKLEKEIKKLKGTTDYNYYKEKILKYLDIVKKFITLTEKQKKLLEKVLVNENQSPKIIALLVCNNLKTFYDEKF